jgi:hypothetical protein
MPQLRGNEPILGLNMHLQNLKGWFQKHQF